MSCTGDGAMARGLLPPLFRRLLRCERGDPIVEFVLVLPLMLILGFGVMEIGRLLWYQHSITKGVRDGARYLTRVPLANVVNDCGIVPPAAVNTATELARRGSYWNIPATITVGLEEVPNAGGAFQGSDPLCMVRMTAAVTVPFPILGAFLKTASGVTFTVSNLARHIGQ